MISALREVRVFRHVCLARLPVVVAFLAVLQAPALAAQGVALSFPLHGYYREGRYVPVEVAVRGAAESVMTLRADGALPVELPLATGERRVTVPMLVLGSSLANPRWSVSGGGETTLAFNPLPKALAPDERLVAVATDSPGEDARQVAALFPRMRIVPVPLDTSRPKLLTPTAAWEALDGVVLDAPAAAKVTESQLQVLLGGGTVVAVRTDGRPGGGWPWRREGRYWVLRHDVAGPRDPVDADTYDPSYAWVRGWPAAVRREAVLGAVVFAILLLAATLWRSPRAVWAGVSVCAIATAGVATWAAKRPPVLRAGGDIILRDGVEGLTQRDRWSFVSALRPAEAAEAFDGLSRPVFFKRSQVGDFAARLVCAPDGRPDRFVANIPPNGTLAFLSRGVGPEPVLGAPTEPVTSPLYVSAHRLYPGRIVGQLTPAAADAENWPAVVLERGSPATRPAD